jgi:membrane protein
MRDLVKGTFSRFSRRGGRLLSGALAFYAMLSVAPLCLIALQVAGTFTSERLARAALLENLERWVGPGGAHTLGDLIDRVHRPDASLRSAATILLLFYASTRLFSQLKRALDILWDVPVPEVHGFRAKAFQQLEKRALSFLLVAGIGVVLVGLVGLKTGFSLASDALGRAPPPLLWRVVETTTSLVVSTALFAVLFRVLPSVRISWRDAFVGALVTGALFGLGTLAVSAYLGHNGVNATYGEAGAVIVLVLWVHYSAQVFLIGAAFTGERAIRAGRLATRPT